MSNTIDKRVVELELDNSQFDRDLKKTESNLANFKEALAFNDVSRSIEEVSVKFSMMEVAAVTMVSNITTSVMNLGTKLIKSLSIDNVSTGWSKFEQKTKSVATMMSQSIKIAGKEVSDYSEKMDVINNQLDKLNWFTDQTSYSFTDMVDNIGKFTAAGQDLDSSVEAMMGIANWAALSGQNAQTASRAMYQLSQALSKGYVQLIDYKSIQNANMDTQEFRQTVLDTAVAMGELTKQGENYITKAGSKFTKNQFTEQLSSKWFTSDILTQSLSKYSSAVDKLYEISEETGLTAAQVIARYGDEVDEFGLKAFQAAQEARTFTDSLNAIKDAVSTGWMNTAEKIFGSYTVSKELWSDLADELYDIFAAGGDARNQILKVWNELEGRADLFKHDPDHPESQGAFWNIFDSIKALVNTVKTAYKTIFPSSVYASANDQVNDLANKFKNFTASIQQAAYRFRSFIESNELFSNSLKSIFAAAKIVILSIKGIRYALDPIISTLTYFAKNVLNNITKKLSDISWVEKLMVNVVEKARELNEYILEFVESIINSPLFNELSNSIMGFLYSFKEINILEKAKNIFKSFFDTFVQNGGTSSNFKTIVEGMIVLLQKVVSIANQIATVLIKSVGPAIAKVFGATLKIATAIIGKAVEILAVFFDTIKNMSKGSGMGSIADDIASFINSLKIDKVATSSGEAFVKLLNSLKETFAATLVILNSLLPIFNVLLKITAKVISAIGDMVTNILSSTSKNGGIKIIIIGLLATLTVLVGLLIVVSKTTARAVNVLNSITNMFNSISRSFNAGVFLMIAQSILMMAGAFYLLSKIDIKGVIIGTIAMSTVTASLLSVYLLFNKLAANKALSGQMNAVSRNLIKIATSIALMSLSIVTIAYAMKQFGNISEENFSRGVAGISITLAAIASIAIISSKFKVRNSKNMKKILVMAVEMSLSLLLLSTAFKNISNINWEDIGFGLLKSLTLFTSLGILCEYVKSGIKINGRVYKNLFKANLVLLRMLKMSAVFALANSVLKGLDWIGIAESIGKFAVVIASIEAISILSSSMKMQPSQVNKLFSTISLFSLGMIFVASSLKGLGSISWETLLKGLTSIGSIIAIIAVISKFRINNSKINKLGASVISIGFSLLFMVAPLKLLGEIQFSDVIRSLITIIGIMGTLSILSETRIANPVKIALLSVSLLVLSAALSSYSESMMVLSNVPLGAIFEGLLTLAGGFTLLALACKIVDPSIETMLKVSLAMLVLGGSMVILTYAISALCETFDTSITDIWTLLESFVEGFTEFLVNNTDNLVKMISSVIEIILDVIVAVIPRVGSILIELGKLVLRTIAELTPDLCKTLVVIINAVLQMLKDNIRTWANDIFDIIITLLDVLKQKIPAIVEVLGNLLTTFIISTLDNLSRNIGPIIDAAISFVLTTIRVLGETIKRRSKEFVNTFIDFGINLMEGLKIGIVEGLARILKKIPMIGDSVADGFRNIFGIHSPSTVMAEMGMYLDEGLAKGIKDNIGETTDSAVDSMSEIISAIGDTLDSDIDDDLVITPVLDLSNVNRGAKDISSLMNSINGSSISVSGNMASSTSSIVNRNRASKLENQNGNVTNTTNSDTYYTTFNVTTNDPEEFARQTDAILQRNRMRANLAKGGV